jgi:Uma2 family endonuclease
MARHIEGEVKYYYDSHSTEEDLMGETAFHAALARYLVEVLTWLFQGQLYAIYDNLNMYQTANPNEYPVAPDVAVIQGIAYQLLTRSWRVGKSGPAPQVVFEIASEETWKKDLLEKPMKYARMGVQEYFAYDPYEFPLPLSRNRRLFGWQLDSERQVMVEMLPRSDGWLWSASLESWLVPDGPMLRLFDRAGKMRLTGMEAEAQQRQAESQRAQVFAEKLRSLGIDPDQLI